MNISALGASRLEAPTSSWNRAVWLGGSSDRDSSLSGLDGDSVTLSAAGSLALRAQGPDAFRADFEKLGALIESGDLAGAKALYKTMQERMRSRPDGDRGPAAIKNGFQALATALESGDAAAAKTAWSSLGQALQTFAPDPSRGGNPMKKDLEKLGKLIDSGDTSAAKELLEDILDPLKRGPRGLPESLGADLSTVSSALESGDLGAARTALDTLLSHLPTAATRQSAIPTAGGRSELEMLLLIASWKAQGLSSGAGSTPGVSST